MRIIHGVSINETVDSSNIEELLQSVYEEAKELVINNFYYSYKESGLHSAKVRIVASAFVYGKQIEAEIDKDIRYTKRVVITDSKRVVSENGPVEVAAVTVMLTDLRRKDGTRINI